MLRRIPTTVMVLVAVLLSTAVSFAQEKPEKIRFTKKVPAKGTICRSAFKDESTMNFSGNIPGEMAKKFQESSSTHNIEVYTINKVSRGKVKEISFKYRKKESTTTTIDSSGTKSETEHSGLAGKTFTLSIAKSQLQAVNSDGEAPTSDQMKELRKDFKRTVKTKLIFDASFRLDKILANKSYTVGDVIQLNRRKANMLLPGSGADDDMKLKGLKMTLKAKKTLFGTECAVFDLDYEMDVEGFAKSTGMPNARCTAVLKGELTVGIENCWLYKRTSSGPITLSAEGETPGGPFAIDSNGRGSEDLLVTYTLPVKK